MRQSPPERHTIIVIPAGAATADAQLHGQRWIYRGVWSPSRDDNDAFHTVLDELGASAPDEGLAALRWWGQTGAQPKGWVSAADPVYLEARLDHLRLHPLDDNSLGRNEREEFFAYLQEHLGNTGRRFALVGGLGYLLAERGFATAACPPDGVETAEPQAFLPPAGAAAEHDRLVGELQLLLHEAPMNRRREQQGRAPVNSIWFWGGGHAPPATTIGLPQLFAGDPRFLGYWRYGGGAITEWQGEDPRLPPDAPKSFVAVLPRAANEHVVNAALGTARQRLLRGQIRQLTVVFSDGWRLRLRRRHLLAVWRKRRGPVQRGNEI